MSNYQTILSVIRETLTDFADSRRTSVEIDHYAAVAARKICSDFRDDLQRLVETSNPDKRKRATERKLQRIPGGKL